MPKWNSIAAFAQPRANDGAADSICGAGSGADEAAAGTKEATEIRGDKAGCGYDNAAFIPDPLGDIWRGMAGEYDPSVAAEIATLEELDDEPRQPGPMGNPEFFDMASGDRLEIASDPLFRRLEERLVGQGLGFDDLPSSAGEGEELTDLLKELGFSSAVERTKLRKALRELRSWSLSSAD
mmetsp:Transcript_65078/g.146774  ORF Transcript_65078/g.146774 Transcript_65078/m.146774 type:complete len:181 (+) Transcript_65078:76-618(+)